MLDRTVPPPFQHTHTFPLLEPTKIKLPNGIEAVFVKAGEQEVAKVEFIADAGKWFEPLPGVAYFTAQVLQKGTPTKNSFQIAEAFDQQGVHLDINPGYDFASLAWYGLTNKIDGLFNLVHEVLTQPVFPQDELKQATEIYLQGLKINLEKTSFLASRQLRQNLFGTAHPYGSDASPDEITRITRDSLITFHDRQYRNFKVICSGKIPASLEASILKMLGSFTPGKPERPQWNVTGNLTKNQFIEKKGSVQSSIRLGKRTIGRTHPHYPGLLLVNHIFGGYFGSRLMKNIREEKGLTYGIHSSVSALKHDCFLSIGADVNKENRLLTIDEINKELKKLYTERITATELEAARNHFIGSMQSEITTPFAHADRIKNIILHELPENFYQHLLNTIEAFSPDDLMEVAKKYFDEESFIEVSVG
jgi:zinc protease